MSKTKIRLKYKNFLGQEVLDHKTFSQEGKQVNKRINELRSKALHGKVEVVTTAPQEAQEALK